jgi:hypothetical protein
VNRKWAWGIVATLATAWILGISAKVMALSEESAATKEILPRIEKKVDKVADMLEVLRSLIQR